MATFLADFPPSLGNETKAGQHYMLIDSFESKNAVARGGIKLSSIGLYIPAGSLTTTHTGNYSEQEGGALRAGASSALQTAVSNILQGKQAVAAQGSPSERRSAGAASLAEDAQSLATGFATKALDATGFISAGGRSPNNYMAVVYGGPKQFRTHSFVFKFFPKNRSETNVVQAIIEEFERGTLPRMSGGTGSAQSLSDPFFKSPRQHEITFYKGGAGSGGSGSENTFLFKIGTSVITSMGINYDPNTNVGFHSDGSPVQIDLSLSFQEIKFQISKDNATGQNLNLSASVLQAQSQRDSNLASLGGQNITPGGGLGGGNDSFR
jgi:hypothetical protein